MYRNLDPQQTKKQICPECRGQGRVMHNGIADWGWKTCKACNGSGYIEYAAPVTLPPLRKPFKPRPHSLV